jgi:endonuclease III-like uncharacterized protein
MAEPRPPDSGQLFQEYLSPFWMMVACMLVNRTHWRQARLALSELQYMYQGNDQEAARKMGSAPVEYLVEVVRPLGFYNQRASSLSRMAALWGSNPPHNAGELLKFPGLGDYAYQSWLIFVDKQRPQGEIKDSKLQWYLDQHPEIV